MACLEAELAREGGLVRRERAQAEHGQEARGHDAREAPRDHLRGRRRVRWSGRLPERRCALYVRTQYIGTHPYEDIHYNTQNVTRPYNMHTMLQALSFHA